MTDQKKCTVSPDCIERATGSYTYDKLRALEAALDAKREALDAARSLELANRVKGETP